MRAGIVEVLLEAAAIAASGSVGGCGITTLVNVNHCDNYTKHQVV